MNLETARGRLDAACARLAARRAGRDRRVEAVYADEQPILDSLQAEVAFAKARYEEALSEATPDHKWEGRRVRWIDDERRIGRASFGTVFTARPGRDYGTGFSADDVLVVAKVFVLWDRPNGKPSRRFERFDPKNWELAE